MAGAYAPALYGTATSFRRQLAVGQRHVDAHALAALLPEEVPDNAQDPHQPEEDSGARCKGAGRLLEDEFVQKYRKVDEIDDAAPNDHRQPQELPRLVGRGVPHALGAPHVREEDRGAGRDREHGRDLHARHGDVLHGVVELIEVQGQQSLAAVLFPYMRRSKGVWDSSPYKTWK